MGNALCLAMCGLLASGSMALHAQSPATSPAPPQPAPTATTHVGPSGDPSNQPAFEVATIKPSKPDEQANILWSPTLFHAWHQSVRQLVKIAYNITNDSQLSGGPAWMDREFFDIEAKPEPSQVQLLKSLGAWGMIERSNLMLRSLLENRFRLKVSATNQVLPVFALNVGKAGPKLKSVAVSPEIAGSLKPPAPPLPPPPTDGAPPARLQLPTGFPRLYKSGPNQLTVVAYRMSWFSEWLSRQREIHRPVVDRTGLDGNYDFVLNDIAVSSAASDPLPPEDSTISLFVALSEQLGLKLEPAKAPLPVLVIDHVEQPSAN